MYFKDVGYLAKEVRTLDTRKRPKVSYEYQKVFCNIKGIGLTEFYQAQSAGLKPEIKVELRLADIADVTHFKYNDKLYKVLRTNIKEDSTELVLTSMVFNNA